MPIYIHSRAPYYGGEQNDFSEADGFSSLIIALYRNNVVSVLSSPTIKADLNKIVPLFRRHNQEMQAAFDILAKNKVCVVDNFRYVCHIFKFLTDGYKVYSRHEFFLFKEIKPISNALSNMAKARLFDCESVREYILSPEFDSWSHTRLVHASELNSFIPTLVVLKRLGLLDGESRWKSADLRMIHDIDDAVEPAVRAIHLYLSDAWWNLFLNNDARLKIQNDLIYVAYHFFKLAQKYTNHWAIVHLAVSDNKFDDLMELFFDQQVPSLAVVLKRETENDELPHVRRWIQNENCCRDLTLIQADEGRDIQEILNPFLSDPSACPKFPAGLRIHGFAVEARTERAFYDAVAILTLINPKEFVPEMWRIIIGYLLPWHLPIEYKEAKSTIECSIRNRMRSDKGFVSKTMHLRLFQPEQYKEVFSEDRVLQI